MSYTVSVKHLHGMRCAVLQPARNPYRHDRPVPLDPLELRRAADEGGSLADADEAQRAGVVDLVRRHAAAGHETTERVDRRA